MAPILWMFPASREPLVRDCFAGRRVLFLTTGTFGRIRILGSGKYQGVLVPDNALASEQDRRVVFVLGADNIIAMKAVRVAYGTRWEVASARGSVGRDRLGGCKRRLLGDKAGQRYRHRWNRRQLARLVRHLGSAAAPDTPRY